MDWQFSYNTINTTNEMACIFPAISLSHSDTVFVKNFIKKQKEVVLLSLIKMLMHIFRAKASIRRKRKDQNDYEKSGCRRFEMA